MVRVQFVGSGTGVATGLGHVLTDYVEDGGDRMIESGNCWEQDLVTWIW